jgi:methylated-DNA-protein-cysteine methyltransferase-like protein
MPAADHTLAEARRADILAVVRAIPAGEVRGYAAVAQAAGWPRHARLVARVLSECDEPGLPWHRVLRSDGRIAFAPGSPQSEAQAQRLRAEGLIVVTGKVSRPQQALSLDAALWAATGN